MLHEVEADFELKIVNIRRGEQFEPEFLKISPNNRIPAMVDHSPNDKGAPISIFESGAILIYLAEKFGKLLPNSLRERQKVLQWLFWQIGGLGPMCGQAHHFRQYADVSNPYGIERYTNEVGRLYGVLNTELEKNEFVAGSYSIADIAIWPWIRVHKGQGQSLEDLPDLRRWYNALYQRSAVAEGQRLERDLIANTEGMDEQTRSVLLGQKAKLARNRNSAP